MLNYPANKNLKIYKIFSENTHYKNKINYFKYVNLFNHVKICTNNHWQ
jgi:hypothetical protein